MIKPRNPLPERQIATEGFAWRESMTLCVAAHCTDGRKQKVVYASDFKVETEIASADIQSKLSWVGYEQFPVLMAGGSSRGFELCHALIKVLEARADDAAGYIYDYCKDAVAIQKQNLINEYVGVLLGMTYDELLKRRDHFPEEQYREVIAEIARIQLQCDLLVVGFADMQPQLVRINGTGPNLGSVEMCANFAAIGSGFYIAESALFQREQNLNNSLEDTIYNVYEAMTLGAKAPGVGDVFSIGIATDSNDDIVKWEYVDGPYFDHLAKQYRRFGPRELRDQALQRQWIKKQTIKQQPSTSQKSTGQQ